MNHKQLQRKSAYAARNLQSDKDHLSQQICDKFMAQKSYQQANTVMWYLHCRSEVRTINAVKSQLGSSKKTVIPYCTTDSNGHNKLGLWLLENIAELEQGTWGILEPPKARWTEISRQILPEELDLIMVPGVAFDRKGGRMGNGAGYYDRLLNQLSKHTQITAVCFESQLFESVIMEPYDCYMHEIITEQQVYDCQ